MLRSANDGASWRNVSPHAVKSIAFDRNLGGRIFFASTDAGILLSTDGGETLHESNVGFSNRTFTSLASAGGALYLSGPSDLYRTDSLAARWVDVGAGPGAGKMLVVSASPDSPRTLFGAGYHGLFESVDGGKTWQPRKGLPEGARVRALLPRPHGILLAGTDRGLFRGGTASPGRGAGTTGTRVNAAPVEWMQSAGYSVAALTSNTAIVSADEGVTWRNCAVPAAGIAWYGLALDPFNPANALAATSLWRVSIHRWMPIVDGGRRRTGTKRHGGSGSLSPDPGQRSIRGAGREGFSFPDGGQTWRPLDAGDGSDLWPSSLLILASAPDRLFALVPSRGVFSTTASAEPAVTQHTLYR